MNGAKPKMILSAIDLFNTTDNCKSPQANIIIDPIARDIRIKRYFLFQPIFDS